MNVTSIARSLPGLCLLLFWAGLAAQEPDSVQARFPGAVASGTVQIETWAEHEIDPSFRSYWSNGRPVQIDLSDTQIGFQTWRHHGDSVVREIAQAHGLRLLRTYYRDIYIFEGPPTADRKFLDSLARDLEELYEVIRVAGPVVRTEGYPDPWLLSNRLSVGFKQKLSAEQIDDLRNTFAIDGFEAVAGCTASYLLTLSRVASPHILEITERLRAADKAVVKYAHPIFVVPTVPPEKPGLFEKVSLPGSSGAPIDPALERQWHHANTGLGENHKDADLDSAEAWKLSTGARSRPLLAIIDSSFDVVHPDLKDNIHFARAFGSLSADDLLNPLLLNSHGTSVSGIAGAVGNNHNGGRGVCPECRLLLLRHDGSNDISTTRAICFAIQENAQVISNSWAPGPGFDGTRNAIIEASELNDIPVLFAMNTDTYVDACDNPGSRDFSSMDENVIAVSSLTDQDQRTASGQGNCADVLAPTGGGINRITTTAVGAGNAEIPIRHFTTHSFYGTSAATPMVAGTIGLMLDADPGLSRIQIQRVLQDTADKVDPAAGHYDAETGFSQPPGSTATHAFGRVNAFEAVSLVARFQPAAATLSLRGHDGKDLLLRDHALDWGNTINPSNELFTPSEPREFASVDQSVDIKIDVRPFQQIALSPSGFLHLVAEKPATGEPSRVYVRLRNRGPETVGSAIMKLYWTVKKPLPRLQSDFWTAFPNAAAPAGTGSWSSLDTISLSNVEYSGSSVAGCNSPLFAAIGDPGGNIPAVRVPRCLPADEAVADAARIVVFDLPATQWDPADGEGLALLAIAHSNEDPVLAKLVAAMPGDMLEVRTAVAWDNNVSLWTEPYQPPCCPAVIKALIVFLGLLAIALLLWIVMRLGAGESVPPMVYVALATALIVLLILWTQLPCCYTSLLD